MTMRSEAAAALQAYIEQIERIEAERKQLGDDIRAIYAAAKAQDFDPKAMRRTVKRRAKDAAEIEAEETIDATYQHAIGMTAENPLYAAVSRLAGDGLAREQVIATLQLLVPINGEIIARVGGAPMRLWRNEDGTAWAAEYEAPVEPEKVGKSLARSATILSIVPAEHVKAAADAAEERSRAIREAKERAPDDEPVE